MSEKDIRKQLTIMVYGFIFKRILPTMEGIYKIGNIEYSNKLNKLILKHTKEGYGGTLFTSFDLIVSHTQPNPVKDSNFNNWVNGTSNPKSYSIINALLEYLYETCEAEEKLIQLKLELLGVVSCSSFANYSDHLIDSIIDDWKVILKNEPDTIDIFRILKDVLYLLKDKNRHISYLLHLRHEQTMPMHIPIIENINNTKGDTNLDSDIVIPIQEKRWIQQNHRLLWGFLGIVLLSVSLFWGNQFLTNIASISPEIVSASEEPNKLGLTNDNSPNTSNNVASQTQDIEASEISSLPTDQELTPPNIITPTNESTLSYAPLKVKWNAVEAASSYDISIKSIQTDTVIYSVNDIIDTNHTVDSKFLLHGTEYKLYIIAKKDYSSSEASVIAFNVEILASPEVVSPENLSVFKLSDIVVEWLDIPESDSYKVVVTDMQRWVKVFEKNYISSTTCTLDQSIFVPGIEYRIYITSQNSSIESTPNYVDIRIENLDAPIIISPQNNTFISKDNLSLLWEQVTLATSYKIEILETNTWETVFSKDGIKETTIDIDSSLFQIGGSYRVYLFAMIAKSSSPPSYLDLKAPELTPPTISQPTNNAVLPLDDFEVIWDSNSFADNYSIVITDTTSWEEVLNTEKIVGQSLIIDKSLLNINGTYRIYVMCNSNSLISAPNYIDIRIEGLPVPNILSPKQNTQYDNQSIRIEWEPSTYITTYKVTITDLSTWEPIYINTALVAEDILLDNSLLQKGGTYRVYIQSVMGSLESEPATIDFSLLP